jgi:hypothetical protein
MHKCDRRTAKEQCKSHASHIDHVTPRVKHFARKRRFAQEFRAAGLEAVGDKLADCEESEAMIACSHCAASYYVVYHCKTRVCPLCAFKVAQERHHFVHAMTKQMAFPKFLTLTMPLWRDDPRDGIRYLRKCFSNLRSRKLFRSVRGGYYQVELKEKQGGWHIHLHTILDSPYLPYQKLFSEWRAILGVSHVEIDIRAIKSPQGMAYATKYASKSADFDMRAGNIVNWYRATVGLRLCATFGEWYNAKLSLLDPVAFPPPEPRPCPSCGEIKTLYYARDGPFLFGHDAWRAMESIVTHGRPVSRDLLAVKQILAAHIRA